VDLNLDFRCFSFSLFANKFIGDNKTMKYAFVFPGQGSQFVGMGKELAENFGSAKEVFEEVNEALDQDLYKIMIEGPDSELTLTSNTQPALMATSMAVVRVLEKEFGINLKDKASYVAGHSLGEYSAACASGVFSLADTAKLLRIRGDAMQQAVPVGVGGMAAVLGLSFNDVDALVDACNDANHYCVAANDNSDGQVVLSGHIQAIEKAVEIAPEFGAKRCLKLPVSAPFHSPLMQPAAETMARAFMEVESNNAIIPIVANVLANVETDKKEIIKNLIEQVTGTVRWRETMNFFNANGVTDIIELGAGKVLSGIAKRSFKEINSSSVYSIQEIEELAKNL
jgi:[acyl-carrier-protein] S-malonyltransferase